MRDELYDKINMLQGLHAKMVDAYNFAPMKHHDIERFDEYARRHAAEIVDELQEEWRKAENVARHLSNKVAALKPECERWQLRFHCPRHGSKDWDAM